VREKEEEIFFGRIKRRARKNHQKEKEDFLFRVSSVPFRPLREEEKKPKRQQEERFHFFFYDN
jgi:hypothetical protein